MSEDHSILEDIDETIERSRKFIQQSKEFTLKNIERKAMLEEKCKRVLSPETINLSALYSPIPQLHSGSPNGKEGSSSQQEFLKQVNPESLELEKARLEIQKQRSQIISLESQVKALQFENENLKKELKSASASRDKSCEIISLDAPISSTQRINNLEKTLRTNSNTFSKLKKKMKKVETVAKKRSKKRLPK